MKPGVEPPHTKHRTSLSIPPGGEGMTTQDIQR